MSKATKNIVAELNRGEKLNRDNYEIWSMIQYVLKEQEVLETLNNVMAEHKQGNTIQHMKDLKAYNAQKRKNSLIRITLLSSMENDVMREYRKYDVIMELRAALKERFGGTSLAKIRKLTIKLIPIRSDQSTT